MAQDWCSATLMGVRLSVQITPNAKKSQWRRAALWCFTTPVRWPIAHLSACPCQQDLGLDRTRS